MRLQFIFNNKQVKITTILFKNVTPILDIDKIVYFKEADLSGAWLKKEFRYSFDDSIWSNWAVLTQQSLIKLQFTNQRDFYIEILYTRAAYNSADIEDFYLFYDSVSETPPDPSVGLIDADLLQSQPGSYYLDRANQTGVYSGIDNDNIGDPSAIGVYDSRVDTSLGTEFLFKKLIGAAGISVSDTPDGNIIIDASAVEAARGYTNPEPVNKTVGGIETNSTFFADGKSFGDTMAAMFYPTLYPNFNNPSNSLNDDASNLTEIGSNINITFNAGFNRGSINPAYGTNGYRSGLPNTYHYTGVTISGSYPSVSLSNTQSISNYLVLKGIQTWGSSVSYDEGEQPLDSIGGLYDSPLPAGNTSSRATSIEGAYPLFGNTSSILVFTKQPLVSMITGNNIEIILVAESGGNKHGFEIPNDWLSSRPLLGVQTFNTFSGQWEYQGNSAAASKTYWDTDNSVTENIQGSLIPYTRYRFNGVDRSSIRIRLIF